jgi:hypothetical protein
MDVVNFPCLSLGAIPRIYSADSFIDVIGGHELNCLVNHDVWSGFTVCRMLVFRICDCESALSR